MTSEQLDERFRRRAVRPGGELYLRPADALDFLDACDALDCALVGVEAFLWDGTWLTPRMDLIADYSSAPMPTWETFRSECSRSARGFLRSLLEMPGIVVSLTVLGKT